MSEQNKPNDTCKCNKKVLALEKEIKQMQPEIEQLKRQINTIIKVLKR